MPQAPSLSPVSSSYNTSVVTLRRWLRLMNAGQLKASLRGLTEVTLPWDSPPSNTGGVWETNRGQLGKSTVHVISLWLDNTENNEAYFVAAVLLLKPLCNVYKAQNFERRHTRDFPSHTVYSHLLVALLTEAYIIIWVCVFWPTSAHTHTHTHSALRRARTSPSSHRHRLFSHVPTHSPMTHLK